MDDELLLEFELPFDDELLDELLDEFELLFDDWLDDELADWLLLELDDVFDDWLLDVLLDWFEFLDGAGGGEGGGGRGGTGTVTVVGGGGGAVVGAIVVAELSSSRTPMGWAGRGRSSPSQPPTASVMATPAATRPPGTIFQFNRLGAGMPPTFGPTGETAVSRR